MRGGRRSPLAAALLGVVHLYRATAVMRSPRCRFTPSCSAYAVTSLRDHGAVRGVWLAVRRLLRCHPWNPGGVDHPPPPRARRDGSGPSVDGHAPFERRDESVPDRPHVRK